MIECNGADPRERAWAEQEKTWQRQERQALGYTAICRICGRETFAIWMVDGVCDQAVIETRPCVPI